MGFQGQMRLPNGMAWKVRVHETAAIRDAAILPQASLIHVKMCRSLVPATANACVPICTPAGGGVIACTCCCRTIVCAAMHSAIDASDAHRCQWTAKSCVRCIN